MTVGEKIKKYRQLKGMTQWELGAAAGFKGKRGRWQDQPV